MSEKANGEISNVNPERSAQKGRGGEDGVREMGVSSAHSCCCNRGLQLLSLWVLLLLLLLFLPPPSSLMFPGSFLAPKFLCALEFKSLPNLTSPHPTQPNLSDLFKGKKSSALFHKASEPSYVGKAFLLLTLAGYFVISELPAFSHMPWWLLLASANALSLPDFLSSVSLKSSSFQRFISSPTSFIQPEWTTLVPITICFLYCYA